MLDPKHKPQMFTEESRNPNNYVFLPSHTYAGYPSEEKLSGYLEECKASKSLAIIFSYDKDAGSGIKGTLLKWGMLDLIRHRLKVMRGAYINAGFLTLAQELHYVEFPVFSAEDFDKFRSTAGYVGKWWESFCAEKGIPLSTVEVLAPKENSMKVTDDLIHSDTDVAKELRRMEYNERKADGSLFGFYKVWSGKNRLPEGCLSNFSPDPVTEDFITYPTTEHYFQAHKFEYKSEAFMRVLAAASPREAADRGRDRLYPLRSDWESVKDEVMMQALRLKVKQNPHVEHFLKTIASRWLVEESPIDSYWGRGADFDGKNLLGRCWMKIIEEFDLK